jgi:ubiquinone/menaquinone biosynthesis C-methylase UbiE
MKLPEDRVLAHSIPRKGQAVLLSQEVQDMIQARNEYHLRELKIARDLDDPKRIMPMFGEGDRIVLDVGCGAGQTLIASQLQPWVRAVGIDLDESALSLGRSLDKRIHFVRASGERIPFRDESFNFVFSRVALPYMHIECALSELWRVLRPEGRMWITLHSFSMTARNFRKQLMKLNTRGAASRLIVMVNGIGLHVVGRQLPDWLENRCKETFQTSQGMTRLLRRVGFENIRVDRTTSFVMTATKSLGRARE